MNTKTKFNLLGQLLLLLATVAWGTSFYILKETITKVNELFVLCIRFLFAGGILSLIFIKKLKKADSKTLMHGFILGLILVSAYIVQTYGLKYTTPSRNAFLTSSYCVLVPFIVWIITKVAPKPYNVISAVLCIIGIGFVAFSSQSGEGDNLLFGDGLTLIGAIFYALQIIFISKYQNKGEDTLTLLILQLLTVGVICGGLSVIVELPKGAEGYILNLEQILKIAYLAVLCTLFAQMAQIYGQKFTTPNQASLILSLEAVFGTLFSVIVGDEKLSLGLIIGFVIIFIAMLINELKLDPVKLFNKKKSIQ